MACKTKPLLLRILGLLSLGNMTCRPWNALTEIICKTKLLLLLLLRVRGCPAVERFGLEIVKHVLPNRVPSQHVPAEHVSSEHVLSTHVPSYANMGLVIRDDEIWHFRALTGTICMAKPLLLLLLGISEHPAPLRA